MLVKEKQVDLRRASKLDCPFSQAQENSCPNNHWHCLKNSTDNCRSPPLKTEVRRNVRETNDLFV